MAAILIVAHAPLASALKAVAAHAFPDSAHAVEALDVAADSNVEQTEAAARAIMAAGKESEWLVLVDVCGATPCNTAQRLAESKRTRVVSGVNVPMLWRTLCYADEPLDMLVARAVAGASQGVMQIPAARPQQQRQQGRPGADDDHHDPQ